MTGRGADEECRGDLLARAQRGALSTAERAVLRAHLASCASCRSLHQVASSFAAMRAVDRGDDGLLEDMAAAARAAVRGGGRAARARGRRWVPVRAAGAAAALVLAAGSASAAVWLLPRFVHRTPAMLAIAPAPAPARPRAPAPPAPSLEPPAPAPLPVAAPVHAHAARLTAAALLHEARAAEGAGHGDEAVGLYRRLQKDFPASTEARVAAVPLGRLLLERASPRAALGAFDRYLRDVPGGALVPEALYGRAQALARLGNRDEQQRTWRRLVAEFPDSPYGAVARRRLSELP